MWKRRKFKKESGILVKISLAIFILLISVSIFFSIRLGLFTIKEIEIDAKNFQCADENQLKNSLNLVGQSFFLMNSSKIEDTLKKKFFCIKSVVISKHLPNKVSLQVFDRQADAVLVALKDKQASSSSLIENIATPEASEVQDSYIVDNEGVVFSKSIEGLNVPKIYIYDSKISLGKKLEDDLINNSLKILDKIKTFQVEIKKSWISDNFFIINPDASGLKIIFNLKERIDIQLASLQLILAEAKIDLKELEFIDLRFDKPIVRSTPKK